MIHSDMVSVDVASNNTDVRDISPLVQTLSLFKIISWTLTAVLMDLYYLGDFHIPD